MSGGLAADLRKCRYCPEKIKWGISSRSGKAVPLNAEPVRVWVPTTEPGRGDPNEPRLELRMGWVSHFATCSGADKARDDVATKRAAELEKRGRG